VTPARYEQSGIVLFVTDGFAVEYAPELYLDAGDAIREADRWAWFLGEYGAWPVRQSSADVRQVGIHDVRLVHVRCSPARELWCGIDLGGTPRLAAKGALYKSRLAAEDGIWGHSPSHKIQRGLADLQVTSSNVSIHRLKTICSCLTRSAPSRREP
jgi:hypothetical protein